MGVADLHDLELIWPSPHPTHVIVTGTFDQWSSSIHLVKGDTGFFGTVKVPWGQKVAYKFIVDGHWKCRDDLPQESDGHGNINNVFQTPQQPQVASPAVHDPPPRLSIPLEGAQSGDIETMVTAVEFLPLAEPTVVRGSLSLPISQISVRDFGLPPSAGTPASISKLDMAGATEGTVAPASKVPAELAPSKRVPSSSGVHILPINDNGSVSLPPVNGNGNGEAHDSYSFATHAPIQFTKREPPTTPSVPESAKDPALSESIVPQSNRPPQGAQDALVPTDRVNAPPAPTPTAVLEPTARQPEVDRGTVVQGHHQQATAPVPIGQASSPSTPPSSTLTHKKRQSLFTRIKHIFDKDGNKRERK